MGYSASCSLLQNPEVMLFPLQEAGSVEAPAASVPGSAEATAAGVQGQREQGYKEPAQDVREAYALHCPAGQQNLYLPGPRTRVQRWLQLQDPGLQAGALHLPAPGQQAYCEGVRGEGEARRDSARAEEHEQVVLCQC